MKNYFFTLATLALFLLCSNTVLAQNSPVGVWKTIDDESGEATSHIEIYEKDGKFHGKIVKMLRDPEDTLCAKCPGDKKDKPLMGMEILWDLKKHKDYWSYGRIMDPNNGKTYKCNIRMENNDELKLRGYIGIAALGRNQVWYRI